MPRVVWENNQLQIQYNPAEDLIKFVDSAVAGLAKQLGLTVEVKKETSDENSGKPKSKIQTVRM